MARRRIVFESPFFVAGNTDVPLGGPFTGPPLNVPLARFRVLIFGFLGDIVTGAVVGGQNNVGAWPIYETATAASKSQIGLWQGIADGTWYDLDSPPLTAPKQLTSHSPNLPAAFTAGNVRWVGVALVEFETKEENR